MYELNDAYKEHLNAIAEAIQASPHLASYLEEEEDEHYEALKAEFEPQIEAAHENINHYSPLEIESFERQLLDNRFEGLFLPRVIGYSVLRPEITEQFFYARQNDHFGEILKFITTNDNFDQLRSRIGQAVEVGFALSSDIYVTGIVEGVSSKRVRQFLLQQKNDDALVDKGRRRLFNRFRRQFGSRNYQYAKFPETTAELRTQTGHLIDFLLYRTNAELNNDALLAPLFQLVTNEDFTGHPEIVEPAVLLGTYFPLDDDTAGAVAAALNRERQNDATAVAERLLAFLLRLKQDRRVAFGPEQEQALGRIIDRSLDDDLTAYFNLTDKIHGEGYVEPAVHEAVREEVLKHNGLSDFNENIRQSVLDYVARLGTGLGTDDYPEWFAITGKQFPVYMKIFANEQFNQNLRKEAVDYTKRLIKVHTNKRGKDYRDVKKTTVTTWLDYGFMNEKQLKEFFKTPRKKKAAAE